MGNPHRKDRYGEVWPQGRLDAYMTALEPLRNHVTISGGWAWHFMSPVGHKELKHAHDHKDLDIFVAKDTAEFATVMHLLTRLGFLRVPCRWTSNEFMRWEMIKDGWKLTIDLFIGNPPRREVNGWWVVPPEDLLPMYKEKHDSRECFAVNAARKLVAAGTDPVGRPELMEAPT